MAELKKSVVAKVAEVVKKEAPKAEVKAEAAPAKKEEVKKAAPAKKAAKKAAPAKKAEVKAEAAPAKKEEAKKAAPAKKAAAKKPAVKKVAEKVAAKETFAVQFAGKDYSSEAIVKLCKDAYKATKNKAAIKTINVYVNIDDSRAYYVVNDEFHGSVEI